MGAGMLEQRVRMPHKKSVIIAALAAVERIHENKARSELSVVRAQSRGAQLTDDDGHPPRKQADDSGQHQAIVTDDAC
jgi:hypothetical protein